MLGGVVVMDLIINEEIKNRIFEFRGKQVMIDRDLAELYQVETRVLNQAVKRNTERFPEDFRFQLSDDEKSELITKCDRFISLKHSSSNPYAFTEQGVSMLSAVLKSKVAVDVSIKIIRTFVNLRRFVSQNASLFQKIEQIQRRQISYEIKTDTKIDKIFEILNTNSTISKEGVFYDGQIFDAYIFVNNLLKRAKKSVILVDNYIDETVLTLFSKYPKLDFTIVTKPLSKQVKLDIDKYNAQFSNLKIVVSSKIHDRFLILDDEMYHIGASLKDLGKKWFAFSKMDRKLLKIEELL